MKKKGLILVTGATGRQGGAAARHLLAKGFNVRTLTRNTEKRESQSLMDAGAELAKGDMEDIQSLERVMAGAYGVYSVQDYWQKGVGYKGEIRQGKNLAQAAKNANVEHFVQASVADADKAPGVEHFQCKWEIEKYIDEIGLKRTFLGEVFFLENFSEPKWGKMVFPFLSGTLKNDTKLHVISVEDIGAIASMVFENPDRFIGEKIDIAGDRLTVSEMKSIYQEVTGLKPKSFKIPSWLLRILNKEMHRQLNWNNSPGWNFSVDETKKIYSQLTGFKKFIQRHDIGNL